MFYSKSHICRFLLLLTLSFLFLCSCGKKNDEQIPPPNTPPRDHNAVVYTPTADGDTILGSKIVSIDISNVSDGYIAFTYNGSNERVKFQICAPNNITYTYLITEYGKPIIFPLTSENGTYVFTLYESVDAKSNRYFVAFSSETEVEIQNEFLPYLTPNVYSHFETDSKSVIKGEELAENCYSDLEVVEKIYNCVINTISYDTDKAKSVEYGYIPVPDETLESGTGICFDYASLMTAMLRSQRIPTKLEVGYAGDVYHAWISCYVDEIGWVANIIEFDGQNWSLMDPTLAANNSDKAVQEYIGDGTKYIVKYTY